MDSIHRGEEQSVSVVMYWGQRVSCLSQRLRRVPLLLLLEASHILVLPLRNFVSNLNLEQMFLENVTRN